MIISSWGIFMLFAGNQATVQMLTPNPPFGLVTLTVLNITGYLMLLGIYNPAFLVSTNNTLRKSIRKHTLESRLLDLIGHAERDNKFKTVKNIMHSKELIGIEKRSNLK
jgi:hypothetical protein